MSFWNDLAAGRARKVVVYGTSLTHGGAWVKEMEEWFNRHYSGQVEVINSGMPGENSDKGVERIKARVLDCNPDLVFVEFSYNDAHKKSRMPVERGALNLQMMIDLLKSHKPGIVIVLQIMNLPWDAPNEKECASARPQLEEFNGNYRRLAAQNGLELLDHSILWRKLREDRPEQFQTYLPDGSHPTDEASLAITWPTIRAYLEKSSVPGISGSN